MTSADGWLQYWSGDISLYVSERHLAAHYQLLYDTLAPHLPPPPRVFLDYGCGEALMAPRLAAEGGRVILVDEAPGRAARLQSRFAAAGGVEVAETLEAAEGVSDVTAMISVSQYIPRDAFPGLARRLAATLKPGGKLIVGDVLPPDNSMLDDVSALFRFAWAGGFVPAAVVGLTRTFRSPYRAARQRLGLTTWARDDMLAVLRDAGLKPRLLERNIGHSHRRYSVLAERPA
jgi:SAM-dependent methyltransferase